MKKINPKTFLIVFLLALNILVLSPQSVWAWVSISVGKTILPADGQSTTTVNVYAWDENGQPVATVINFSLSPQVGSVSPASITTGSDGRGSTIYTAGTIPGYIFITATSAKGSDSASITLFGVVIEGPDSIVVGTTASYYAKTLPSPLTGTFDWQIIKKKNAEIQGSATSQSVTVKGITPSTKKGDTGLKVKFRPTGATDSAVDSIDITVLGEPKVKVLNVDASDPFNAKVNYQVEPPGAVLTSATFTAPGKTETKNNISGNFYFTFSQKDLSIGENEIKLKADLYGSINTVTFTATRVEKSGSAKEIGVARVAFEEDGVYFIVSVPFNHDLYEWWNKIKYSIPTTAESKIIWVGKSSVNIRVSAGHGPIPTEIAMWDEYHSYNDSQGEHLRTQMLSVSGPTLPPQSEFFQSKDSSNDAFFSPDNLRGIGEVGMLAFDSDAGPVFAWPIINSHVDLIIK